MSASIAPFFIFCLPELNTQSIPLHVESLYVETIHRNLRKHLSSDGDLDLNTGVDVDDDLLDNLGGGVEAVVVRLAIVRLSLEYIRER